jgi:hypothetical protein
VTEKSAENVAESINNIDARTPLDTTEIDSIISNIEDKNAEPLPDTKVSEKRKRRRRTKP